MIRYFLVKFPALIFSLYECFLIITPKSSLQTVLFQVKFVGSSIFLESVIRLTGKTWLLKLKQSTELRGRNLWLRHVP